MEAIALDFIAEAELKYFTKNNWPPRIFGPILRRKEEDRCPEWQDTTTVLKCL